MALVQQMLMKHVFDIDLPYTPQMLILKAPLVIMLPAEIPGQGTSGAFALSPEKPPEHSQWVGTGFAIGSC